MKKKWVKNSSFILVFFTAILLFPMPSALFAQGVTYEHVAKMNTVTGSVISDDGNYVAYTVSVPADAFKENSRNATHLYVLHVPSGKSKPYYTDNNVSQVTFRPGKGTVAFLSKKSSDNFNALYELSLSGGEAVKLFGHSTNILNYEWGADGNNIAFMAMEDAIKPVSPLTYSPDFYEENFTMRKAYIANVANASSQSRKINVEGSVYMLSWSPDKT
nr:hypothetical protein [Flavobacteriales bacterium]